MQILGEVPEAGSHAGMVVATYFSGMGKCMHGAEASPLFHRRGRGKEHHGCRQAAVAHGAAVASRQLCELETEVGARLMTRSAQSELLERMAPGIARGRATSRRGEPKFGLPMFLTSHRHAQADVAIFLLIVFSHPVLWRAGPEMFSWSAV
jgi:hypothetical protein